MEIVKIVLDIHKDEKLLLMRNVDLYIYTEERKYHYTRQMPRDIVMLGFREMIDKIYHFLQKEGENGTTPNEKNRKPKAAPSLDPESQGSAKEGERMGSKET